MKKMSDQLSMQTLQQYEQLYLCPISIQLMNNPVDLPCSHTFDRKNIIQVLVKFKKCPLCQKKTQAINIKENMIAKQGIEIYKKHLIRKQRRQQKRRQQKRRQQKRSQQRIRYYQIDSFQIFIKSITTETVRILPTDYIAQVKMKYCQQLKRPLAYFQLSICGKVLQDNMTIHDYNITKNSTVFKAVPSCITDLTSFQRKTQQLARFLKSIKGQKEA